MNYLLDTHVYIWFGSTPNKLSSRVLEIMKDRHNTIFLSAVSIWEMQIKIQTGKLQVSNLQSKIATEVHLDRIKILPIELDHIYTLDRLPLANHRDPFDRLLVAQALYQNWPLLSHDPLIAQYPITTIW
jgi:PIN domain nuclease of toxin-antitoxin system